MGLFLYRQVCGAKNAAGWVDYLHHRHCGAQAEPSGSVVTASCGAVEAFARGLAIDLAPIRVNAIAPGLIATPLHERRGGKEAAAKRLEQMAARLPLKRVGRPEDIADAVLFLMKNQFVTGITLTVDGGGLLV